jgi:glyoxylase-like metal-dependent hydrolase (beta-lactamase superfamily II)
VADVAGKKSVPVVADGSSGQQAIELAPGLWRLDLPIVGHSLGGATPYLVRESDGFTMIDCGMDQPECWQALETQLQSVGASVMAIKRVIATHGHPDHAGLAPRIRAMSGAEVYLHQDDLSLVSPGGGSAEQDRGVLERWLERYGFSRADATAAGQAIEDYNGGTAVVETDRLLEDGETLAIGIYRFEVVWTPGHTPGHICLYDPALGVVMCGDHLFANAAPNIRLMPHSPITLMSDYLDSLRRVGALRAPHGLPGHGATFDDVSARADQVVQHQLNRQEQLLGLLGPQPQTAHDLAVQVWSGDRPGRGWTHFHGRLRRNAALLLAAHLELMALEGRVRRHDDGVVAFSRPG